ncbi:hypothetical protein VKT23_017025 [Stygiomarasmius scandens]|uniref:Cytochrome P450 n=1 Tax=Marasmiellus scandens TaxID=2682957 RepID=A0ABR1IT26_9AGAR
MYSWLFLLLCTISIWFATLPLYRLFLHPLRRFPGPWLASLTDYYAGYYDLIKGGGFLKRIEQLHARYGPVVRVGPNTLHFAEPQAFDDIYAHGISFVKANQLYRGFVHASESSAIFMDPKKARQRRMLLSPLFSRRAITKLKDLIQDKVDKLTLRIKDYPEEPVNLAFGFRSLTMEIITSYCFATGYDTLEHPTFHHPLIKARQKLIRRFWLMKHFPSLVRLSMAAPIWIIKLIDPGLVEPTNMMLGLKKRIKLYLEDQSQLQSVEHETIFHRLIMPETKGGVIDQSLRPSEKSLLHEANSLIGAGSDSVADTCCIATCYALHNREIIGKLKEELCEAWPDEDSTPDLSVLEQLPYLTALIKEALRFSHGVVTPLPRTVGSSDAIIGGFHVPAGTDVEMSCVFLHKNPIVFQDPNAFSPERWMGPNSKELENYLVPFSKGPRMCLGIK